MLRSLFPDGLDAPGVVRNLLLAAAMCGLLALLDPWPAMPVHIHGMVWPTCSFSLGALWMIHYSARGKRRLARRWLDLLDWRGDETVLDAGCGQGLLSREAARRVPQGRVTGVNIWSAEDLSSNTPERLQLCAQAEGWADLMAIHTADMRHLPFADGCFSRIVSSAAIHNLPQTEDRRQALDEIVRVLAADGQIMIHDIRHLGFYARQLRRHGLMTRTLRTPQDLVWTMISLGLLRPGTLVAWRGTRPQSSRPGASTSR